MDSQRSAIVSHSKIIYGLLFICKFLELICFEKINTTNIFVKSQAPTNLTSKSVSEGQDQWVKLHVDKSCGSLIACL